MAHPIAEANEQSPFGALTPEAFYSRHNVSHVSEYTTNPRGLKLFTQWWTPLPPTEIVGTLAIVHCYTSETSWFVQLTAVHFAKSGFAVCAIDHQGHGFSDGLVAHIPDINLVVDDCISFFDSFRANHASKNRPSFLYSESLGGAIALLITLRQENGGWDGLILNGAMCVISPKFKPPWPLEHLLFLMAAVIQTWRVVPTRGSLPDVSFKEEWKRKLALASPRRPVARPRAATALKLLRVCKELQGKFEEVEVPLLIVHASPHLHTSTPPASPHLHTSYPSTPSLRPPASPHLRRRRFILPSFSLRGSFPPDTLSSLDQLRSSASTTTPSLGQKKKGV